MRSNRHLARDVSTSRSAVTFSVESGFVSPRQIPMSPAAHRRLLGKRSKRATHLQDVKLGQGVCCHQVKEPRVGLLTMGAGPKNGVSFSWFSYNLERVASNFDEQPDLHGRQTIWWMEHGKLQPHLDSLAQSESTF